MTESSSLLDLTSIGRAIFLAGVFLMVTGDWPQSTLLPGRWVVPLRFLAWPWLYLILLTASFVVLASSGALHPRRSTTADFMRRPVAVLTVAFLLSVVFSQAPSLSWWAFGCFLGIVVFGLAVMQLVEDDTFLARLSIVLAAATLFLVIRVIMWRFDQGSAFQAPFHIRNNAWLGKIQIAWVLNLIAPFLLARFLVERGVAAIVLYGGAWLLAGAAIYLVFARIGIVAFALTTLILCVLNANYWRRTLTLLTVVGVTLGVIAAGTKTPPDLIVSLGRPGQDVGMTIRQAVWRQTIQMIVDHPMVGIGLGSYDDVAHSQYGPPADPIFFHKGWHAHNSFLHVLAETGIVGFLAGCYLGVTLVRFLLRRWRAGDRISRLNSSALLCVLIAFFVLSMTEAMLAARVHASLRMNLTLALLVFCGLRLASKEA